MEKNELIRRLKKARNTEESIIAVSAEHLRALTLRSGVPKEKAADVRAFLQEMIGECTRHREKAESLIADIEQEERNDY